MSCTSRSVTPTNIDNIIPSQHHHQQKTIEIVISQPDSNNNSQECISSINNQQDRLSPVPRSISSQSPSTTSEHETDSLETFLGSLSLDHLVRESHFKEELIDQLLATRNADLENLSDSETIINENQRGDEPLKLYKLRGASNNEETCNSAASWVRPPSHFDEQAVKDLTNEQLESTLEYFILSGYRVSQMTKTYDDIEAVTKLLDEKEKDLELAATIGKQLLERDQELEAKIEFLEIQLEKTTDMVNQLRYDISLKDNLLKTFLDSEYEDMHNEQNQGILGDSRKLNVNVELLNDYKRRLESLEYENEVLRSQAEHFEKESKTKESKEAELIAGCISEYHNTQSQLRSTQDELRYKTAECQSQQEEIRDLFTQIFELQLRIKTINNETSDMHLLHEQSKQELLHQISELKEKYGECMVLLAQTQDELSQLRKKSASTTSLLVNNVRQRSSTTNSNFNYSIDQVVDMPAIGDNMSNDLLFMVDETEPEDDDETSAYDLESSFYLNKPIILNNSKSSLYSPWMLTTNCSNLSNSINTLNNTSQNESNQSLAAELFSTMAREYRSHNQTSHRKLSKSSDFVRKVRQHLKKNLPGSSNTDSMQSDSEVESTLVGRHPRKLSQGPQSQQSSSVKTSTIGHSSSVFGPRFPTCPTPDSCLSTGSASIYSSSQIARSHSAAAGMYALPEKLQIVKPIEGSQTLQHWQHLATPNLGCLFETRPGIAIKGSDGQYFNDDIVVNNKKEFLSSIHQNGEDDFDDGIYEDEGDFFEDEEEFLSEFYDPNDKQPLSIQSDSGNMRVLTPTKVQLLSKLLSNEENKADQINESEKAASDSTNNPVTIIDFFKNISTRYFNQTKSKSPPSIKRRQSLLVKAKRDCDDPDTPPSSPINLPNSNDSKFQLFDVIESAKNTCKGFLKAPTPPATPNNELEDEDPSSSSSSSDDEPIESQQSSSVLNNMHSFFDQIAAKLNVFSSFTTKPTFVKPSPVYPDPREIKIHCGEEEDPEVTSITSSDNKSLLNVNKVEFKLCSTPPPSPSRFSPSKFSPPLPDLLDNNDGQSRQAEYTQEEMRKSAFVRVTSLNPFLNKSIDLNHLLDSLSTLRRGQQQQQKQNFYGGLAAI